MADAELANNADAGSGWSIGSLLWRGLPFLAVLALAIVGVAYMNVAGPMTGYWEFLAFAAALLCISTGWQQATEKKERTSLVWKQAAHWIAVLIAMGIVLWSNLNSLLPAPATSLILLLLIALGTFLAGISLSSIPIGFLGVAMALAVPTISWFKQSALFIALGSAFVVGLLLLFLPKRKGSGSGDSSEAI